MACPNWPNWPANPNSSAAALLNRIILRAGNNPDAQDAKAAAIAGLTTTVPKTSAFSCEYYYGWVTAAWDAAQNDDWAATLVDLNHLDDN